MAVGILRYEGNLRKCVFMSLAPLSYEADVVSAPEAPADESSITNEYCLFLGANSFDLSWAARGVRSISIWHELRGVIASGTSGSGKLSTASREVCAGR